MKLMDREKRVGLTTLTLILPQGCSNGFDVWISSPFLETFQLRPAGVYLWERINVLTRVQFYCMEEKLKLGVQSVLLK